MKKTVEEYMAMGIERPYAEYFASGRRRIIHVKPCADFSLLLTFEGNEVRRLDMRDTLKEGVFQKIAGYEDFSRVYLDGHTVCWDIDPHVDSEKVWNNQIDLCPDLCYVESIPVKREDRLA